MSDINVQLVSPVAILLVFRIPRLEKDYILARDSLSYVAPFFAVQAEGGGRDRFHE